jgi:PhnB protein
MRGHPQSFLFSAKINEVAMAKPTVKPIPDGLHTVTPYLIIKNASKAIDFCKQAFGATELMRMAKPDGRIGHAMLRIGDSVIMLADEAPEMGARGPQLLGGTPVLMHLYVEDVDAVVASALAAGATLLQPVADQFYGDRSGGVTDPFGHVWYVATHKEDMSDEQLQQRFEALAKQKAG